MVDLKDLDPKHWNQWCPGCGDFGILNAVKLAIVQGNWDPHDVVIASGIGCSGKIPHYVHTYGFEGIHGRALPAATGIKLANHELVVFAAGGDGDGYGIGMGHFIHAMRRNIDITYIVHDNEVYGLTTGQASPTSAKGFKSKSTPHGLIDMPVNPIKLALASDCTFVSRGYSGDPKGLANLLVAAAKHKGFALVDVIQPCVTYRKDLSYAFFKPKIYDLKDEKHDTSDKIGAWKKAEEWDKKIPIGVFYQEERPTYTDELKQLHEVPLVKQDIADIDVTSILDEYK